MSELRWNVLLGEWVVTGRSGLDATTSERAACAICETAATLDSPHDVVVVEDPAAVLQSEAGEPAIEGTDLHQVAAARGGGEIVVYSRDHATSLADLTAEQVDRIVRVWADRCAALADRPFVRYIHIADTSGPFATRDSGHPHTRIRAYPFVPPATARKLARAQEHYDRNERCLFCDLLAAEDRDGRRVVADNGDFVALVPFAARWPFEVQILPRHHLQSITRLDRAEMRSLASIARAVLRGYESLFGRPIAYVMAVHQDPSDRREYDAYHLHFEIRPREHGTASTAELETGAHVSLVPAERAAAILRDAAVAPER
jgi:UDPglucose--hexose-1-phosphate uridylyltransferase